MEEFRVASRPVRPHGRGGHVTPAAGPVRRSVPAAGVASPVADEQPNHGAGPGGPAAAAGNGENGPKRGASGRRRQASLRDVAKAAGVSVATVSMVLNDNPRISRATQTKVRGVMRRLDYQPNRLAQSLSGKHTRVLAVMLPSLSHAFADAYFGELLSGISDAAHAAGWKLLLEQAKPGYLAAGGHVELYERRYVDGVLMLGTSDALGYAADFARVGCPAVVLDNRLACPDGRVCDHVVCDYAGGAQQALSYLKQLGHETIGLLTAAPDIATSRDVTDAWRAAAGGEGLIHDGRFTEQGGAEAAAALLDARPDATAILAANDKMAIGAMHWLARRGVSVPGELSVIGVRRLADLGVRHAGPDDDPFAALRGWRRRRPTGCWPASAPTPPPARWPRRWRRTWWCEIRRQWCGSDECRVMSDEFRRSGIRHSSLCTHHLNCGGHEL